MVYALSSEQSSTNCANVHAENASAAVWEVVSELLPGVLLDAPLMEAGLDSLGAVEVRHRFASTVERTVNAADLYIIAPQAGCAPYAGVRCRGGGRPLRPGRATGRIRRGARSCYFIQNAE